MQLTRQTDYGLRTLIYLALHPGERVPAARIAGAFRISQNHLMKVIQKLADAGLIRTQRGKHGGISLASASETIQIGDVVRELEGEAELVECHSPLCAVLPECDLKSLLAAARDAFFAVLDNCSLDDLVHRRGQEMRALLTISAVEEDGYENL